MSKDAIAAQGPLDRGVMRLRRMREKAARILRREWIRIRYGKPTAHITGMAGHCVPAEIEYRARDGRVIGFWAYGYWEPGNPYQGEFEDA